MGLSKRLKKIFCRKAAALQQGVLDAVCVAVKDERKSAVGASKVVNKSLGLKVGHSRRN